MNTLLVAYDLNKPGKNYSELIDAIKGLGSGWWHHLDSTWLVKADLTPVEARNRLATFIDSDDELLVINVTNRAAAWRGFNDRGSKWIKDNL